MKTTGKLAIGLALASVILAQPALADGRAVDPRLGAAPKGAVVPFRQSAAVARKNEDVSKSTLLYLLAGVGVVGGTIALASGGGNDKEDAPASP